MGAVDLWINPRDINISGILFDFDRLFISRFGRFLSFRSEINSLSYFSDMDVTFEPLSQYARQLSSNELVTWLNV